MPTAFIPSPSSNGFYIGPLFFHAYGICYVVAVAAAIMLTRYRWQQRGGDPEVIYTAAWWGFPAGLIGGRLYFLATTPSQIPDHWWGPFAIWDGGLGIWGGIALGAGVGVWRLKRDLSWSDIYRLLNCVAPALLVAQGIGRIGNYFNQELFGKPSTLPWALKISPAHRPPGFEHFATFQPSFLYELIWDLLLAVFLIWIERRKSIRPPGLFALYVAGYSGYRIFEETIRIDYSVHILGMRLNFWIALIGTLAGLAFFARIQFRKRPPLAFEVDAARSTAGSSRSARPKATPAAP
jgi:prolipoprotein diacylglyceryl transferase